MLNLMMEIDWLELLMLLLTMHYIQQETQLVHGQKITNFHRISTTIPFMRDWVDHTIFLHYRKNKKSALNQVLQINDDVLSTEIDFSILPISIARFMKDAIIFTDIK